MDDDVMMVVVTVRIMVVIIVSHLFLHRWKIYSIESNSYHQIGDISKAYDIYFFLTLITYDRCDQSYDGA